jgi:hypothetical protein
MSCRTRRAEVAAAAIGVGALVARAAWKDWGATVHEQLMDLPGDDLLSGSTTRTTRAIAIHASAEEVWPWLVQMGQGRGGMYSYDVLENLLGLHIHSVDRVIPELQGLAVGDRISLVHEGWMGTPGYSLPVAVLEPNRALVLRQQPPEHPWDAVWSFVLEPQGHHRCRLISRSLSARPPGLGGAVATVMGELMDPIALVMTRRMLIGIKERAEAAHHCEVTASHPRAA